MVNKQPITRRNFIKGALAATGAFVIVPRHVLGGQGYTPPSEMITHAIIGVGSMGLRHIKYVQQDNKGRLLTVCDVDDEHLTRALERAGQGCKGYKDFRDVLGRDDIDVVHIVTPPHWHCADGYCRSTGG